MSERTGSIFGRRLLAALLCLIACQMVTAKETRYLTGNAADVKPKLHGPAYHLQGGGDDVAAAMQWMINEVRGCTGCAAKLDVVVLRSSGEDGYNDFIYKMNGVDFVERDRMGRLLVFVARQLKDGGYKRITGLAVERETSVVVNKRGAARILGKGPVYLVLGDHKPEVCEPGKPLTFSGYKLWKFPAGATFNLKNRPKTGFYLVSVREGKVLSDAYQKPRP